MDELQRKYDLLIEKLKEYPRLIVAYSGGVDSTFLAFTAQEVLGNNTLAVTVKTAFSSQKELERASNIAKKYEISHRVLPLSILNVPEVAANDTDRCYHCKKAIFNNLQSIAKNEGYVAVVDGGNWDDRDQYRPGRKALQELGIISPLFFAELTKEEIRELSRRKGLPTWNLPSQSCLATRFPYGTALTRELLKQVDTIENSLKHLGLEQVRLRHHGELARIELGIADFYHVQRLRNDIVEQVKSFGYRYVCLDLEGYRFGSMDQ